MKIQAEQVTSLILPSILSDGMVLQRDSLVRIWGYAPPRENITLSFCGEKHSTVTDIHARWEIHLHDLKAGGPFEMAIATDHSGSLLLKDILVGDVYLCGGQSNMQHTMDTLLPLYQKEVDESENTNIRQFKPPIEWAFGEEQTDYDNTPVWHAATPETVLDFSGVGYFFAKDVYESQNVPIGFMNASQGGSPCEAWMSESTLEKYPNLMEQLEPYKKPGYAVEKLEKVNTIHNNFYRDFFSQDKGQQPGQTPWYDDNLDTSDWKTVTLPCCLTGNTFAPMTGIVWLRKTIILPRDCAKSEAKLILGTMTDADMVFVNGTCIGETTYLYPRRKYDVPEGLLREGENIISIRLSGYNGVLSVIPDKDYELVIENRHWDLKGVWQYKISHISEEERPPELFLEWQPSALFNGMLAPMIPYSIRGIIWYQAESNEFRAEEYRQIFPDLIKCLRKRFCNDTLPFLFVQLPNFGEPSDVPEADSWADIRDAQASALILPRTAMAVTYDVGEWNDLHPLDKKSVGHRLALLARHLIYGEDIESSGPFLIKVKKDATSFTLCFDHIGSGLTTRDGNPPSHIFLKENDGTYVKANAAIADNTIVITCDNPDRFTELCYAQANTPIGANIVNKEGLPCAPFRVSLKDNNN